MWCIARNKNICDVFIEMHKQWTKKYYGNHCTVQFCTVQFCFEIKHVMALFWNQANRYVCLGISECKMFGWSHAPVTFVDVLWSLFHLLKGMSVRMEHATASSASSDAVEIRLQELRSSAVTRGREWLQDALAKISVMDLRKMADARNVGRGPDNKWLAVGELRARLLDVLAPRMQVRWGRIGLWRKLHVCHMVQCCRTIVVLWWQCVRCCRWTRHRLPNWKNFALELFHRARSGWVVLWTKCEKRSFESWLLRVVCRHIPTGIGCL